MSVGIVSDTAASLPPDLVGRHGVVVVPMQLTLGSTSYVEDQLTLDEVIARLEEGVQTAGPAPGAFAQALEQADQGAGVLVITVAERLSSTVRSAQLATRLTAVEARVLDSGSAAAGEGLVVLAAAAAAERGATLDDVEARARSVSERVRLVAAVDSLKQLVRGGRIPELAGRTGQRLGIRPLFELRKGRIRPLRPAFGAASALDGILSTFRRSVRSGRALHVAALHAANPGAAQRLLEQVTALVTPVESFVGIWGPVMVAHTGPGVAGLAWWWDDEADPVAGAASQA